MASTKKPNASAPAKKNAPAASATKLPNKDSNTVKLPAPRKKPGTSSTCDKENSPPNPDADANEIRPRPTGKAKKDRLAKEQSQKPSQPDSNATATATSQPANNTAPVNAPPEKPAKNTKAPTAPAKRGRRTGTQVEAPASNAPKNMSNNDQLSEIDSLKAQLAAQKAENALLKTKRSSNNTRVNIPGNDLIPKPANTTKLAQAMQMDDGPKKHSDEYMKIRHDVYRKIIQLGVNPETDTIRSLGFGRVATIVNVIRKEMPVFERYHQAWPIVEIIQSLIKNRRHTLALKRKTNKGEGKGKEQVGEEEGDDGDDNGSPEVGQLDAEGDGSDEEDDEDEDGDGAVVQREKAQDDYEDEQEEGNDGDEAVQPPDVDGDNNDDDDGDNNEMDVAPTNANGAYHYSQDGMDDNLMENPPSPIQMDDDQDMQGSKSGQGKKRKAGQAGLTERDHETKRMLRSSA